MARVGRAHTSPELAVRRWLHANGFRFRLHRRDLAGTPDLVLPRYRIAVFVHGCFWHRHSGCRRATVPKTRREFWEAKLTRNTERDRVAQQELVRLGWHVVVVWECETKKDSALRQVFESLLPLPPPRA
jgi:DNA mismatch endonuclease (patch repair protein)